MENTERQDDEIDALRSIYDHFQFLRDRRSGIVSIFVEIPSEGIDITAENGSSCNLNFLPPIKLRFKLSNEYPESKPPLLNLSCAWLDIQQLMKLD